MNNDKKLSVSQYLKAGYTNKSRDSIIRMLRNNILPENVKKAELVGVTYILTIKTINNILNEQK
jgi:hypothetical protein